MPGMLRVVACGRTLGVWFPEFCLRGGIRGEAGAVEEMLREYGESYWGPGWVRGCEVRVFKAFARAGAPGGGRAPK